MVSTSLLSTEFLSTSDLPSSLSEQFNLTVRRFPQKAAVSDQHRSLTFQELWDEARVLAISLERLPTQSLIAIENGVSAEHIVAIWAVILAGHCYIILPPGEHSDGVIQSLGITASISIDSSDHHLIISQNGIEQELSYHSGTERHKRSAACVVMTSGSTGEPKLVVFEDQHILFESWRQNLDTGLCPEDNLDLLFSFHFSASLACIFPALLTGASLHLLDLAKEGWAILPEWWQEHRITIANLSTSTFRKLISLQQTIQVPSMKMLGVGAESMSKQDVTGFIKYFPDHCELQQSYASTEARTISQWLLRKHGWDHGSPVPVGYPVSGKQIRILTPEGSEVEEGNIGEIFVESEYIPATYWNPQQHTWQAYLQQTGPGENSIGTGDLGYWSPAGSLILTGRKDFQLKIRGQKVSPEWVEQSLGATSGISDQVSVAQHQEHGYIGVLGPSISREDKGSIHQASLSLPPHMRPGRWFQFREWPTNRNGKFDRKAIMTMPGEQTTLLPEIHPQHNEGGESSVSVVATLMEEVLEVQNISPTADFFDELGGDSLNAVEVWGTVLDTFSLSAPFEMMKQLRSAEVIGKWVDAQVETSVFVPLSAGKKSVPPIICLSPIGTAFNCYKPLVSCWEGDQPLIGLLTPFGNERKDVSIIIQKAQSALEARFPTGQITLCGFSYAGVMVVEIGKRLIANGRKVNIILIDTPTYRPTSILWKCIGYPLTKLTGKIRQLRKREELSSTEINAVNKMRSAAPLPTFYRQQLHLLHDFSPVMTNNNGMTIIFEALVHTQPGFHYKREMNWEKWVSGKVRKYALPTTHSQIAKSPWIKEISRVIQLLLPCDQTIPVSRSPYSSERNKVSV